MTAVRRTNPGKVKTFSAEDRQALMRLLAHDSFVSFVYATVPGYIMGWVHERICAELDAFLSAVHARQSPRLMLCMPPRHGKEIADSEPVLTPEGWVCHGDLRVGMQVYGLNGQPVRVLAVATPNQEKVAVEFTNGEVIKCHPRHEWTVYDRGLHKIRTLETRDIAACKYFSNRARFQLPLVPAGVEFEPKKLPLDPYVLGVWLGDGTTGTGVLNMARDDAAVWSEVQRRGFGPVHAAPHPATGVMRVSFGEGKPGVYGPLTSKLSDAGVLENKHIPEDYLRSSRNQRLSLLAGLMDTDGHVEKHTGRCRIVTTFKALRDGIFDLCTTLGFRPYVVSHAPVVSSSGIQGRKEVFTVGFQPFEPLPTILERRRVNVFAVRRRIGIAAIRPCADEPGRCIQVDSPDGLYLVGKSLLPTHNSELASRRFPAYVFGRFPDMSIIGTSYSADLSSRLNRDVQRVIEQPEYEAIFPETRLSAKNIRTSISGNYLRNSDLFEIVGHKGSYRSAGVGGGITGMGGDILIIDDPFKDRAEADSPTIRRKVWEWYTSTLYTRLAPGGGILVINTRWHMDDLSGRLLEAARTGEGDQWRVVNFPAIAEEDEPHRRRGEALHPERYPLEQLAAIRIAIGTRDWEALYQQHPTPDGGNIFKAEWLRFWLPKDLPEQFDQMVISWDMTFKDGDDTDYVVGQVWGRKGADRYLLDQVRARMGFTDTLAAFRALADKWPQATRKLVEDKANGPAVIDSLRHHVSGIIPVEPDGSKTARAHAVTALFEAGNVHIPHPQACAWASDYVAELTQFPGAAHDDQVDATTQALRDMDRRRSLNINPAILRPAAPRNISRFGGML